MRVLTNFMNSEPTLDLGNGVRAEFVREETWPAVRRRLKDVDLVVIDCRDSLLYRLTWHFLLFPWRRRRLVAVDLVLRQPLRWRHKLSAQIKKLLFRRVDHFIHYFRDISGYARYFGISPERSSYVPFKVNIQQLDLSPADVSEDYVFTMGVSLRDYDTYIRAIAQLPYPAAIPQFSLENFEGRGPSFPWDSGNMPRNLTVLPDSGGRADLLRNLARARLVVIPTQANSLCASGISTYLEAMFLGKCVIHSATPGASDLLTEQALMVPPHDVTALKSMIARAWEDAPLRHATAEAGRRYAHSLGGERELLERIHQRALSGPG
jgi:glycosyltransferase involved in cell wall biosynthesis